MSQPPTPPPDDANAPRTPKKKVAGKKRPRTIEVTVTKRELEDPNAILRRVMEELEKKQQITPKFVVTDAASEPVRNEQLEAKATAEAADHLDKKAETQKADAKPGEPPPAPAPDTKKVDEARGRIRRSLVWLAVNGVKLVVKSALDWAKEQVKKLGGG